MATTAKKGPTYYGIGYGPSKVPNPAVAVSIPVIWAITFLKQIGAPVTPNNIRTIIAWGQAESGDPASSVQAYGGWNNFNPLNVVHQPGIADVGMGGRQGDIANFGDVVSGATASAHLFLNNHNAQGIIAELRRGSASASDVNSAVSAFYGTWGGHINFAGINPNLTGSPAFGTNTAPSSNSGNPLGNLLGNLPIVGPIFAGIGGAVSAQTGFYSTILGLFTNWRYVVEVWAGITLIGIGILIVAVDTGAAKRGTSLAAVGAIA
jgi:hypothetical protein